MKMKKLILIFLMFISPACFSQVTSLSCSGDLIAPPNPKMAYTSSIKIDRDKNILSGDIFSYGRMSGIPVSQTRITSISDSGIVGAESFTKSNGQKFTLNVSLNRVNGEIHIFEFPDNQATSYKGFFISGLCKVQKQLF